MTNWASPSGDRQPDDSAGAASPPPYRHLGSPGAPTPPQNQPQNQPRYGQYAPGYGPVGQGQVGQGQVAQGQYGYGAPQYAQPYNQPYNQQGPPPPYADPRAFAPKPGVIPLRPLVLGDILEGAFRTVRGNPSATIGLAFIVATIFAIPTVLVTIVVSNTAFGASDAGDVLMTLASYAGQLVSTVASILLSGMLIVVVAEAVLGHRASIGEAWERIRPRLWALLGATFLVALAVIVVGALLVGLGVLAYVAAGTAAAVIVAVLGAVLFLCAAVWVTTRLSLAPAAITLEGMGPIAGLKRSWALTDGQFWRILGITLLTQLLIGAIVGIIMVPAMLIAVGVLATTVDDTGSGAMPVGFLIFMQVLTIFTTAITAPFTSSVTGLLYLDQRIRREAFDLELMNAAGLK